MIYSQNDEQIWIENYFGDFIGTFADFGANDGITLSNTYALVERGWSGLLVEASPKAYERLLKTHPYNYNLVCLNYAIGSYDGEIILHESGELLGTGDVALVSSTKQDETERWTSLNMPFEDIKVPVLTFESLLKFSKHKKFDLISTDIEGMEREVIPQLNFTELGTKMAIIEFNGKDEDFFNDYMGSHGFKLIHKNAENLIYTI